MKGDGGDGSSDVSPRFVLQGAGTDEKVLVEILASRTPREVNAIKAAYKKGKRVKPYIYFVSTGSLNHPDKISMNKPFVYPNHLSHRLTVGCSVGGVPPTLAYVSRIASCFVHEQ